MKLNASPGHNPQPGRDRCPPEGMITGIGRTTCQLEILEFISQERKRAMREMMVEGGRIEKENTRENEPWELRRPVRGKRCFKWTWGAQFLVRPRTVRSHSRIRMSVM